MNTVFDACVNLLVWLAKGLGLTYVQVNVLLFCIIWPAITLGLIAWVCRLKRQRHTIHQALLLSNSKLLPYIHVATIVENLPATDMLAQKRDNPRLIWQMTTRGDRMAGLIDVGYTVHFDGRWIECHQCHTRDYHPVNIKFRYCAKCEAFHVLKEDDTIPSDLNLQPTNM